MEFSYSSNRFRRQLETQREMAKAFGDLTKKLQLRLKVLSEAKCLADVPSVPPDRCHPLDGQRKGQFAVDLSGNWRLIFEPDQDPLPRRADGGLDAVSITAIKLLEVTDYHN